MSIAKVIKIVTVPRGDAPRWVREAWVGCVMPCEPECGHIPAYVTSVLNFKKPAKLISAKDVIEGKVLPPQKVAGYSVDTKVALDVLRKKSRVAAKWFYDNGYPVPDKAFRFSAAECKVIECVPDGKGGTIVRYDDMETGTMRPIT